MDCFFHHQEEDMETRLMFRNLRECFKLASEFADKGLLERGHKAIEGMARANA